MTGLACNVKAFICSLFPYMLLLDIIKDTKQASKAHKCLYGLDFGCPQTFIRQLQRRPREM